jgi:choline dehydrogenase
VPLPANPLAFNGTGPLHVSHPNFAQIFASYIDGAMEESGIPFQQDFASGHLLGRQYAPLTMKESAALLKPHSCVQHCTVAELI